MTNVATIERFAALESSFYWGTADYRRTIAAQLVATTQELAKLGLVTDCTLRAAESDCASYL